jgi:hypothetical protein
MLGHGTRDARRTERFLDSLVSAEDRRAPAVPVDVEVDPDVRVAALELRDGLVRVHPSFRFEEALAARLATSAQRMSARQSSGPSVSSDEPETSSGFASVTAFPGSAEVAAIATEGQAAAPQDGSRPGWSTALRRWPDVAARPRRPLIVGGVGVGVASAAISLGAVYVAWRHSHQTSPRSGGATRASSRSVSSGSRRVGVINGILGVVS